MGDLTRRGFVGFLASLPFLGRLVPAEKPIRALRLATVVNHSELPKPQKLTALMFNPKCYIADRGAWLRRIIQIDKPVDVLFHVTMPCCGYQVSYPTLESLPQETVPCPCGQKDYNVVQWPAREPSPPLNFYNKADECGCLDGSCSFCVANLIEIHWDTLNRDIWTRPKGGDWKNNGKFGVS